MKKSFIIMIMLLLISQSIAQFDKQIALMEQELNITLTNATKEQLESTLFSDSSASWHIDAEKRIESYRKGNLEFKILDSLGTPWENAQVEVKLLKNSFHFGGILHLKTFAGVTPTGITPDIYQKRALQFFNTLGLDNGLKPKLRARNEHLLPDFFAWCKTNNIASRGHALIWPGNPTSDHLPKHLRKLIDSIYASKDPNTGKYDPILTQKLNDAIDSMIVEWASLWPVYEWDVYNEPFGNHEIQEILGYDVMIKWFKLAKKHSHNPDAGLFINDNRMISAPNATAYDNRTAIYHWYIDSLINGDAPITGIGFQNRIKFEYEDPTLLFQRLDDFSHYNLDLVGTEFHIPASGSFNPTQQRRAQMTNEIMTIYYSHQRTTGLNCWSFLSDKPENGAFLNSDGSINLNGLVWYYNYHFRFATNKTLRTNKKGEATINGHKGDYEITIITNNDTTKQQITHSQDSSYTLLHSKKAEVSLAPQQQKGHTPLISSNNGLTTIYNMPVGATVQLFSLQGRLLQERTLRAQKVTLNTTNLSRGVYLYRISVQGMDYTGSFLL